MPSRRTLESCLRESTGTIPNYHWLETILKSIDIRRIPKETTINPNGLKVLVCSFRHLSIQIGCPGSYGCRVEAQSSHLSHNMHHLKGFTKSAWKPTARDMDQPTSTTKSLHAASSVNRPCSTSVVKTVVIGSGARCAVPPAGVCVKNLLGAGHPLAVRNSEETELHWECFMLAVGAITCQRNIILLQHLWTYSCYDVPDLTACHSWADFIKDIKLLEIIAPTNCSNTTNKLRSISRKEIQKNSGASEMNRRTGMFSASSETNLQSHPTTSNDSKYMKVHALPITFHPYPSHCANTARNAGSISCCAAAAPPAGAPAGAAAAGAPAAGAAGVAGFSGIVAPTASLNFFTFSSSLSVLGSCIQKNIFLSEEVKRKM